MFPELFPQIRGDRSAYDFSNAPVTAGTVVTFSQVGPLTLFYDTGTGPCANVTQTNGTTPPLDSFRRDSVGVLITGQQPVPTMNQWFMLALAALLIGGAASRMRRSQLA